jgi:hypothetical protein
VVVCLVRVQVRLESDTAAVKQKEAEAASTAQERDALRNKLKALQDQILRGDQATARTAAAGLKVSVGGASRGTVAERQAAGERGVAHTPCPCPQR